MLSRRCWTVAGNHEKKLSALAKLQDEISQLNKIAGNHEKNLSALAKLQDEILQLNMNTSTSIAGVKNELSQWKSNVAANYKMEGAIAKLQKYILQPSDNLLRCPTEWIQFRNTCYHLSLSTETWVEAQRQCASVDAHLVVINNAEEQEFLGSILQDRYWIGLSDTESEDDWRWVDGTDYSLPSINWNEGEPNDANNAEDCAEILGDGKLNDLSCDKSQRWICERSALIVPEIYSLAPREQ
ncbi:CD209 antigen-like protein C isoform X2 [Hypanus sabinus]|uniref:CD209 antigen-like protein C isoform X2 n=1 Tax=Hypanus sabinus TaxID=79690 RepID=UPI0028C3B752|nr:CD209 antigen-like protein C isoform X2 [Hypanus sabinus]